jgi:hypothetical protein
MVLVVGCGSQETASESDQPPTSTSSTCEPPQPGASVAPKLSAAGKSRETRYLTDVSVDTDSDICEALVIFEFERRKHGPGFKVSYEPASIARAQDGSGKPVAIEGSAFLVVRINPAMTAKINGDQVTKTYTGPNRVKGDPPSFVHEVVKTGDFENTVTWVIGLDRVRPFKTIAYPGGLEIVINEPA